LPPAIRRGLAWAAVAAALAAVLAVAAHRARGTGPASLPPVSAPEKQLEDVQVRLQANPDDIKALAEKGFVLYQLGPKHYLQAIAALESARDRGSLDPRIFYCLGDMYREEGLYDYARRELERCLNNFPDNREARLMLGKLYYQNGDYDLARDEFLRLSGGDSADIIAMENAALAFYKSGKNRQADSMLDKMRALGPQAARRADFCRANMDFDGGRHGDAAKLLEALLAQSSLDMTLDKTLLLRLYAKSLEKLDRRDDARDAWRRLAAISPSDEEAAKKSRSPRRKSK